MNNTPFDYRRALLLLVFAGALSSSAMADDPRVERGRYLVMIAGCNDCHTAAYAMQGGKVPEAEWLLGDVLGWRGPWGTTYPINLRLYFAGLTEDQWLAVARKLNSRPPMPWFSVVAMSDEDLRALYHYISWLGPAGKPAPAYLPPDQVPPPPFVQFP